jgi:formylglycine-generating enzyme required for sulfatase activity
MAGKIFINYRRDDSASHALNVAQYLENTFGKRNIFIDIDRLRAGLKFKTVLEDKLGQCKVMLAIIGPNWVDARDGGSRRIDNPEDWVRVEIERALARNIPVIPVLVAGATLPSKTDLPPTLQPLIEHQCATVTTTGFRHEMAGLARDVADLTVRRPWGRMAAAASALILGGYLVAHPIGEPVWWPFSQPNVVEAPSTPSALPAGKTIDEAEAKRKADEAKRRADEQAKIDEEAARVALAEKNREQAAQIDADRRQAEAEAKRRADEAAKVEENRKAEEDRKRAEAEAKQRAEAKIEADRRQAEADAKRRADEAASQLDPALSVKPGSGQSFRDRLADGQPCSMCPEMVVVPAGKFAMGFSDSEKYSSYAEGPQHEVVFAKPFAVGKFEVTFDEWDTCVAQGGCAWKSEGQSWARGRHPVMNVSWDDVKQYAAWIAKLTGRPYRLLSEAEWEYAARAGTATTYSWGDDIGIGNANCDGCGSQWDNKQTAPVGSFKPNDFGLYDMHGNVLEWVEDPWHYNYSGAPKDGSAWLQPGYRDNSLHVARGGSWSGKPQNLRAANRSWFSTVNRFTSVGFRLARTINP